MKAKPKPTLTPRKQRQLEKRVAEFEKEASYFRGRESELTRDIDGFKRDLKASTEYAAELQRACELEVQTRRILAESLRIERQDLIARADRLAMRIRGLGFEVQHE